MLTFDQLRSNRDALFLDAACRGLGRVRRLAMVRRIADREATRVSARHRDRRALAGFVLSMPMRYIYRALSGKPLRVIVLSVHRHVLRHGAGAARGDQRLLQMARGAGLARSRPWFEVFASAVSTTYLLLCWSALYFGIEYYENSCRSSARRRCASAALAQEAQLKMLRYQLNPHFLFNTLNAISTLILDNQNRTANHAVTRLSEFLRYTLDQDPMKKVTLRQEMEALDLYMNTERLRFGGRLEAGIRRGRARARSAGTQPAACNR